jgi:integrase
MTKLKILHRLDNFNMSEQNKFKPYITHLSKNSLNLVAENEEEEKLLKEMEKALINKIKRLKSKKHNVNIESDEIRDTQTLKKVTDEYIKFKQKLKYSNKRMYKFTQSVEFLIIFFGEKKLVKDFTSKDNVDFQMFLLSIPSDWKRKKALADKDLKKIYDKSPKTFDEYEKLSINTANEIVSNVISMFEFFKENNYIYTNQFKRLPSIIKRESTQKREFTDKELKKIFFYLKNKELMEEYRYMKFLLYTGLRREEGLIITKNDILWEKYLIEIDGTKTENARRICIIHKDLIDDLEIQLTGKNDDDYLFFNLDLTPQYRSDKVGNKLNAYIKDIVGKEIKKEIDLHSLRKNFAQTISLSGLFSDLELKTLIGHSTRGDITDTHYIKGKRNWVTLKERIDKVDFSEFF